MNGPQEPIVPADDKNKLRELFLRQVELLDTFLRKGAISKTQHEKSLSCLMKKMKFDRDGNRTR